MAQTPHKKLRGELQSNGDDQALHADFGSFDNEPVARMVSTNPRYMAGHRPPPFKGRGGDGIFRPDAFDFPRTTGQVGLAEGGTADWLLPPAPPNPGLPATDTMTPAELNAHMAVRNAAAKRQDISHAKIAGMLERSPQFQSLTAAMRERKNMDLPDYSHPGEGDTEALQGVRAIARHWRGVGNSNAPFSVAMMLAAHDEMGTGDAHLSHVDPNVLDRATAIYDEHGPGLRAWANAQYAHTQAHLKAAGTTSVPLYRGMSFGAYHREGVSHLPENLAGGLAAGAHHEEADQETHLQPLSSHSSAPETATGFGGGEGFSPGIVYGHHVPASRIFANHETGMGVHSEGEHVVLGGTHHVYAHAAGPGMQISPEQLRANVAGPTAFHPDAFEVPRSSAVRSAALAEGDEYDYPMDAPEVESDVDPRWHSDAVAEKLKGNKYFQAFAQSLEQPHSENKFSEAATRIRAGRPSASRGQVAAQSIAEHWRKTGGVLGAENLLLQHAVHAEFGKGEPHLRHAKPQDIQDADKISEQQPYMHPALRAWARAQYDHTQDRYAKAGVKHISLVRGLRISQGDIADGRLAGAIPEPVLDSLRANREHEGVGYRTLLQPMASYTSSPGTAAMFARRGSGRDAEGSPVVTGSRFPVTQLLGSHETGLGKESEDEHVVLGGEHRSFIHAGVTNGPMHSDDIAQSMKYAPRSNAVGFTEGGDGGNGIFYPDAFEKPRKAGSARLTASYNDASYNNAAHDTYALSLADDDSFYWRPHTDAIAEKLKDNPHFQKMALDIQAKPTGFDYRSDREEANDPKLAHRNATDALAQHWNAWGGSINTNSVIMQRAIHAEFGTGQPSLQHVNPDTARYADEVEAANPHWHPALRAWARAQYDHTQEHYKKAGVTSVPLARGLTINHDDLKKGDYDSVLPKPMLRTMKADREYSGVVPVKLQPASSFSQDTETPAQFHSPERRYDHGVVMGATFPTHRILGSHETGLGTNYQTEHVVLGGTHQAYVHASPYDEDDDEASNLSYPPSDGGKAGKSTHATALAEHHHAEKHHADHNAEHHSEKHHPKEKHPHGTAESWRGIFSPDAYGFERGSTASDPDADGDQDVAPSGGAGVGLGADLGMAEPPDPFSEAAQTSNAHTEAAQARSDEATTPIAARLEGNPQFASLADAIQRGGNHLLPMNSYGGSGGNTHKAVRAIAAHWARTTQAHDPMSIAMMQAAHDELGTGEPHLGHIDPHYTRQADAIYAEHGPGLRAWANAQYAATQEHYAKKGVTSIPLYRGLSFGGDIFRDTDRNRHLPPALLEGMRDGATHEEPNQETHLQPLSSHSGTAQTAQGFGGGHRDRGIVFGHTVPVEQIFGSHETGLGTRYEQEHVVLGGTHHVYAHAAGPGKQLSAVQLHAKVQGGTPFTTNPKYSALNVDSNDGSHSSASNNSANNNSSAAKLAEGADTDSEPETDPNGVPFTPGALARRAAPGHVANLLRGNAHFARMAHAQFGKAADPVRALVERFQTGYHGIPAPAQGVATMMGVRDEFGLHDSTLSHIAPETMKEAQGLYNAHPEAHRAFARAQYNHTQKVLQDNNVTHIPLARSDSWLSKARMGTSALSDGFGATEAQYHDAAPIQTQPFSSYSADLRLPHYYASQSEDDGEHTWEELNKAHAVLHGGIVPAHRIFSVPASGMGANDQAEALVLGGKHNMKAVAGPRESFPAAADVAKHIGFAPRDDWSIYNKPDPHNLGLGDSHPLPLGDIETAEGDVLLAESPKPAAETDEDSHTRHAGLVAKRLMGDLYFPHLAAAICARQHGMPKPDDGLMADGADPNQVAVHALARHYEATPSNANPVTVAMMRGAAEGLGKGDARLPHVAPDVQRAADALYATHGEALKSWARAQYAHTQAHYNGKQSAGKQNDGKQNDGKVGQAGKVAIPLYRGVSFGNATPMVRDGEQMARMAPLSSHTASARHAISFAGGGIKAGAVMARLVPTTELFASHETGMGQRAAKEHVVLGGTHMVKVTAVPAGRHLDVKQVALGEAEAEAAAKSAGA